VSSHGCSTRPRSSGCVTERLDLRAVDVRKFEAAFHCPWTSRISYPSSCSSRARSARYAARSACMLEEFFVGERPPLPSPRSVMFMTTTCVCNCGPWPATVRAGIAAATSLPFAHDGSCPTPSCAHVRVFHQGDRSAHCLVVRFDDGLVPATSACKETLFGRRREVPAVPLASWLVFERLRYTASVRQPPFEAASESAPGPLRPPARALGTSAQPEGHPLLSCSSRPAERIVAAWQDSRWRDGSASRHSKIAGCRTG